MASERTSPTAHLIDATDLRRGAQPMIAVDPDPCSPLAGHAVAIDCVRTRLVNFAMRTGSVNPLLTLGGARRLTSSRVIPGQKMSHASCPTTARECRTDGPSQGHVMAAKCVRRRYS
jgi:hypothetical protein